MQPKDILEWRDVVVIAAALAGMVTGFVSLAVASANSLFVAKNFLVNHPSYKGIAERELEVYDKINEFDAALSPFLTRQGDSVEVSRATVVDLRDRLKSLAADVFCPEALRTDLYKLVAHLRQFERGDGDLVEVPTQATREAWQAVKDRVRRRVRQFVSYSEPHLLFKVTASGDCEFIAAFRSRWRRARYIAAHRNAGITFTYWPSDEKPPLFRRLLT